MLVSPGCNFIVLADSTSQFCEFSREFKIWNFLRFFGRAACLQLDERLCGGGGGRTA